MAAKKKSGCRQSNGDADAAAALMREFGDPPDSECIQFDADGKLIHMPEHMRERREWERERKSREAATAAAPLGKAMRALAELKSNGCRSRVEQEAVELAVKALLMSRFSTDAETRIRAAAKALLGWTSLRENRQAVLFELDFCAGSVRDRKSAAIELCARARQIASVDLLGASLWAGMPATPVEEPSADELAAAVKALEVWGAANTRKWKFVNAFLAFYGLDAKTGSHGNHPLAKDWQIVQRQERKAENLPGNVTLPSEDSDE